MAILMALPFARLKEIVLAFSLVIPASNDNITGIGFDVA